MAIAIEAKRGGVRILGSGGGGKGGGGGARSPVEMPDSLHNTSFAAVLDALGNGEMAGPVHADQPLRDIYLDGTPIQNADGSLNFRSVQVDYRVGTQDQEHIAGFPAAANVTSVGAEVGTNTPWTQLLTNPDLSAVRISLHWPQLLTMVDSGDNAGDRIGARVEYAIDLAVGSGSFVNVLTSAADGKTINGYTRTHRVDLPAGAQGWTVRVRRLTPDSSSSAVQSRMMIQSYAEVIDGKYRYPMTALVGIRVDAEQFQAIPTRAYHWRGQIIRVPANYDPVARTYSGVWDGTFKRAWSNNPAWVFYDMITNRLYGLGDRIDASMVDRYALYQIGAYCDQMVADGQGGTEPRFVCNAYLQSSADALRVVNDLASVFRGMTYWANGQAVAVSDMPSDPVYTYPNERVVGGRFNYIGADLTTLKTVALVSWNDPTDFYRAKVEVVTDYDGVRQHGIRKTELVAFGCTSRGQAQRVGLYHLYTSRMEQGGVSFSVGLDGVIPQPGSLIKIADQNRAGRRLGGLIAAATTTKITLDFEHPVKVGDRLTVNLPSGKAQTRQVSAVAGRVVTVSPGFNAAPTPQAAWSVEADDLALQHARVISIKERDGITFDVSAVEHHPGKFDAIDYGVRLEALPVSVVPPRVQMAPTNVRIREHYVVRQGQSRHIAEITWDAVEHALFYDVQWRRDNSGWVQVPRTGARLVEIPDFYTGEYIVRVRAINGLDVPSLWAYSEAVSLTGQVSAPQPVTHLVTASIPWGIRLSWGFPAGPNIIERTEIRYSATQSFADSRPAGGFAYPTDSFEQTGLAINTEHYFWARLVDKNGTLGPWYPAESALGVRGIPSQVASEYNDLITEEIVAGGLGELIMGDIRDIPNIRDAVGELNVDLGELNGRVEQINGQVQELLSAGEWDVGAAYAVGTVVFADGKMYRAKQAVPAGTPITSAAHWELIGDYASITDGLAALAVQAQETITRVENAEGRIQANAENISTVAGQVNNPETGLGALGSAVQSMRVQVGQLQDGLQSLSETTTALNSKIDGIEIGGVNLWRLTEQASGGGTYMSREWIDTVNFTHFRATVIAMQSNDTAGIYWNGDRICYDPSQPYVAGQRYTFSFEIKTTNMVAIWFEAFFGDGDRPLRTSAACTPGQWVRVVREGVVSPGGAATGRGSLFSVYARQAINPGIPLIGEVIEVRNVQLEVGNKASAFSLPAQMVGDRLAASAQAVQSLTTRVTATEGRLDSQASSITLLGTSVTNADAKAVAAQQAAAAAADAAGAKGEVIFSGTAPPAAKRLAQNLWIDTTGNANTPKRWNGSAWVAVTDKAATDAASAAVAAKAAADAAQATANQKADASAVNALTTRVEQAEGGLSSQGQDVTALQNTVNDPVSGVAATAGALNDTKSRVTNIEGKQEAQATNQLILNAEMKRRNSQEDAYLESVLNQAQTQGSLDLTKADLAEFKNVQAEDMRALAESITTLQASIGQDSAAVEQIMRSMVEMEDDFAKIYAGWGIKLLANTNGVRYVAGVGLDLTNESGVMQSTFAVLADRFAVMHAVNGNPVTVFSVQNGASILNTALIGYASIGQAHIADAAISRAKIQWAAIGEAQIEDAVITNAKIRDASITSAKIADANITRAKIGYAEVDTLRLAGNAVAVQVGASAPALGSGAHPAFRDIGVTLNLPYPAQVTITADVQNAVRTAGEPPTLPGSTLLYINGGVVESVPGITDAAQDAYWGGGLSYTTTLAAGSYWIVLQQKASIGGVNGVNRRYTAAGMSIISTMR